MKTGLLDQEIVNPNVTDNIAIIPKKNKLQNTDNQLTLANKNDDNPSTDKENYFRHDEFNVGGFLNVFPASKSDDNQTSLQFLNNFSIKNKSQEWESGDLFLDSSKDNDISDEFGIFLPETATVR